VKATVRVPASSANLGPGFDILAVALQLQFTLEATSTDDGRVVIDGVDHTENSEHLVARSYLRACDIVGVAPADRGISAITTSEIPQTRGLGSSAAVTVAGILAAVALHRAPWDEHRVLREAAVIEGHPDNAAAALLGGFTICAPGGITKRIDVPGDLHAVLYVPDLQLNTEEARKVIPDSYSRADAVHNAANVALFVRAITCHDYDSLVAAMRDKFHQPQRTALLPWLPDMIAAAQASDAAAALSGAGPTVIALTAKDPAPVISSMETAAKAASLSGKAMVVGLRNYGSRVDVRP
jgi:homoserine kinase